MPHPYGIIVHPQAVIGRRVTVMQQVMIGGRDHRENIAPVIGDDVYIGAGARVLGDVRIGNGVVIGANAVVTRDIPPGATVVGADRIVPTRRASATPRSTPPSRHSRVGVQRGPRRGPKQLVSARALRMDNDRQKRRHVLTSCSHAGCRNAERPHFGYTSRPLTPGRQRPIFLRPNRNLRAQ